MQSDEKPIILVSSGTSKTGSEVAKQLLATCSYSVRVGSRNPSKLSALSSQGGEAVLLDTTPSTAVAAFSGVHAAYIMLPSIVGGVEGPLFEGFLQAAKQARVKHIVYLSAIDAEATNTVHKHYHYEQLLMKSGLPFTILRPTYFHENVIMLHAPSIKKDGVFITSGGNGVYTTVSVSDVAAVAVAALSEPAKHIGQIYQLTTETVTDPQLADKLSKALGRKVAHVNVTPEEHLQILTQKYPGDQGAALAAALVTLDKSKSSGQWSVVDPSLERVLGRKGISLDQFLADTHTVSAFN